MKRSKIVSTIIAVVMIAIMLTGCLSVEMKISSNGSCEMIYTIDTSELGGMMSKSDLENTIQQSVDSINTTAGKKIAKLKSVKEDEKKQTITASISITDLNKLGDGTFFGTVKDYRKEDGTDLDNMMTKKEKEVDEKKISDNLSLVYLPMTGTDQYGIIDVSIVIPGTIEYLTNGGDLKKNNTAYFNGATPLVVYKKGGGFPVWLLIIAVIVIAALVMRKKKSSTAPLQVVAPIAPQAPPVIMQKLPDSQVDNSIEAVAGTSDGPGEDKTE